MGNAPAVSGFYPTSLADVPADYPFTRADFVAVFFAFLAFPTTLGGLVYLTLFLYQHIRWTARARVTAFFFLVAGDLTCAVLAYQYWAYDLLACWVVGCALAGSSEGETQIPNGFLATWGLLILLTALCFAVLHMVAIYRLQSAGSLSISANQRDKSAAEISLEERLLEEDYDHRSQVRRRRQRQHLRHHERSWAATCGFWSFFVILLPLLWLCAMLLPISFEGFTSRTLAAYAETKDSEQSIERAEYSGASLVSSLWRLGSSRR
jgi:uncharacterized membrane protein YhdT